MRRGTGIEIGPDYCAIVGLRRRRGGTDIEAARLFGPEEWPDDEPRRASLLQETRVALGLARNAALVVWSGATLRSIPAEAQSNSSPEKAGFDLEEALTPAEALQHLSTIARRPAGEGAVAWLALTRRGGAIAIARDSALLHAREFEWRIAAPEERAQAHLLRRYLLVAQLLPQIRAAIAAVRDAQQIAVDVGVACGTLPDLRSLTMPLIEELDIEIETLDAPVDWAGASVTDLALPSPAAMQLARAAADRLLASGGGRLPWWMRVAVVVLAAGATWSGLLVWSRWTAGPTEHEPVREAATAPRAGRGTGATSAPAAARSPDVRGLGPVIPRDRRVESTMGTGEVAPEPGTPALAPLPVVDAILIAPDRRLAVIDGSVVGVGDRVHHRLVVRIEPDAVVFRDEADQDVRVRVSRERARVR